MSKKHHIRIGRYRIGHFLFLFLSIVLLFALRPFLEGLVRISFLTDLFLIFVLISGVYAISGENRKVFLISLVIAGVSMVLQFASYVMDVEILHLLKRSVGAVFFAYALVVILRHILMEREVTGDLIMAAACAYFLIGIIWAFIFHLLETIQQGSFSVPIDLRYDFPTFLYFSFVTLASLGYGDITPISPQAQSLSVLEAVMGQLFLAVTIARLVGIHTSQSQLKEE